MHVIKPRPDSIMSNESNRLVHGAGDSVGPGDHASVFGGTRADVRLLAGVVGILDSYRELAVLGHTHVLRKGRLGHPAGRLAGRADFLHHAVDLLEGETLGFPHEEVGVDEAASAQGAPKEEDLRTEVGLVRADEVGGNNGDDAIPSGSAIQPCSMERL